MCWRAGVARQRRGRPSFGEMSAQEGPAGRQAVVKTVWIINAGEHRPRFVTAFAD